MRGHFPYRARTASYMLGSFNTWGDLRARAFRRVAHIVETGTDSLSELGSNLVFGRRCRLPMLFSAIFNLHARDAIKTQCGRFVANASQGAHRKQRV